MCAAQCDSTDYARYGNANSCTRPTANTPCQCHPHVLARQFEKPLPNQAWVSDITCIRTHSGWLYLAAVLDLHSRKIVGWAMSPEMPATLVCTALQMAIVLRSPTAGLVVHSDRGTQYASAMHQGWSESDKRTTPTTQKP